MVAVGVLGDAQDDAVAVAVDPGPFRFVFTNAVSENEAAELYAEYPVPGSGIPLFQAAFANLNPASETKVNSKNPERGPLLIISGEKDNTVPWAIANASYKLQTRNSGPTEITEIKGAGHSLVIDGNWSKVADVALEFLARH